MQSFYVSEKNEILSIKNSIQFNEVLTYAWNDSVRKFTSIFTRNNDEILADEFVYMCGYGEYLESAFRKITNNVSTVNKGVTNNHLVVLLWTLQVYHDMKHQRIRAISTLNKAKSLTASTLEKKDLEITIRSIRKIDDIALQEAYAIIENSSKGNSLMCRLQRKGIRSLEEDVYEYEMRIKNVEEEDEALLILRQINMRMSMLYDYFDNSSIDEKEEIRIQKLLDKYNKLREELSKKTIYNRKNLGLWIDYNYLGDINR